jgi:hypothetical protein
LDGIQWRTVEQLFREQQCRYDGGIALQVLKSRDRGRSARLCFRCAEAETLSQITQLSSQIRRTDEAFCGLAEQGAGSSSQPLSRRPTELTRWAAQEGRIYSDLAQVISKRET